MCRTFINVLAKNVLVYHYKRCLMFPFCNTSTSPEPLGFILDAPAKIKGLKGSKGICNFSVVKTAVELFRVELCVVDDG